MDEDDLEVRFRKSKVFVRDCAHYGIADADLARLVDVLSENPFIGSRDAAEPDFRLHRFAGHVVRYRVADGTIDEGRVTIWLLRMTPAIEEPPKLTERALKLYRAYKEVKAAVSPFWSKGDDDEGN